MAVSKYENIYLSVVIIVFTVVNNSFIIRFCIFIYIHRLLSSREVPSQWNANIWMDPSI